MILCLDGRPCISTGCGTGPSGCARRHEMRRQEVVTDLETIARLRARIASLEAEVAKLREALSDLEKAGTIVSRYGAQTGPHWPKLSGALIKARAALSASDGRGE